VVVMGVMSVKKVNDIDGCGFGLSTKGGIPSAHIFFVSLSVLEVATSRTVVLHLNEVVGTNGRHNEQGKV
jgi:hypothetical protein